MQVDKSACPAIKKSLTSYIGGRAKVEQGIEVRCTIQLLTISIAIACRVK